MSAITLTEERLEELVAARVGETLPEAVLLALAEKAVAARVGRLTLAEAQRELKCANQRQLLELCARAGIPMVRFGPKRRFILIRDIEAADERFRVRVGAAGTRVEGLGAKGEGLRGLPAAPVERRAA